ncbi:MAG TPA: hypothetical protein VHE30_28020 [Polyangiaceae bacterium]|nr:hypothetical protein [Polyangiaceae bacterium]
MGLRSVLRVVGFALAALALPSCGGSDASSLFAGPPGAVGSGGGGWQPPGAGGSAGAFGTGGSFLPPNAGGSFGVGGSGSGGDVPGNGGDVGAGGTSPEAGADAGDPLGNLPPALRDIAKCSFTGTWGTFVTVPVNWPGAPFVLLEGQGTIMQWTLSHRVQDSLLELHETVVACSIFLPDLQGSVLTSNQKFGIRFPNEIFDRGVAPPWPFHTTAYLATDHVEYDTELIATLTGITLPNPTTDAWPVPPSNSSFRDDDQDGSPGVTVNAVDPGTDPSYNFPPVGLPQFLGDYPRARTIDIVSRSVAKLHGTVTNCDELNGSVAIQVLAGTPAINSTVIGCVRSDGQTCVQAEADFLNQNRPQFTPTGLGTFKSVRLAEGATCADVRARFPN